MTDSAGSGERTQFSLLNDEPVAAEPDDQLGAGLAARRLAQLLLASRAATPFTLAVDAGWGMGKSSLMRLVDAELQKEPGVHAVWYNAWTSTGADALEGLIKSVLMRFDRRVLRRGLQRVTEQRALIRAARALLVLLAGAGSARPGRGACPYLSPHPYLRPCLRRRHSSPGRCRPRWRACASSG
ncbi:P-loop NTPase fold protein [Streptomyces sp. NPDC000941]